jgi:hypothetical protein
VDVVPLDVMDYIYKDMYECIVNKKTPLYAPFIMKLILDQQINHPFLMANLTAHKKVKLQRKAPTDHSNDPFAPMEVKKKRLKKGSQLEAVQG